MKRQPWNLLSSAWGEIWGRGWAHGTERKQFTVDAVIKITMMSFIVWVERLNGEKIKSSSQALSVSLMENNTTRLTGGFVDICQKWMERLPNSWGLGFSSVLSAWLMLILVNQWTKIWLVWWKQIQGWHSTIINR